MSLPISSFTSAASDTTAQSQMARGSNKHARNESFASARAALSLLWLIGWSTFAVRSVHAQDVPGPSAASAQSAAAPAVSAPAESNPPPESAAAPAQSEVAAPSIETGDGVGRIELMDAWLTSLDRTQRVSRLAGGIGAIVLGGLDIAGGCLVAFRGTPSDHWERPALAAVMLGSGVGMLAGAISLLANPSSDETRYARWRAFAHIDALTLAHFEGELAADAASAHTSRLVDGTYYLGVAAGGALTLALTPLAKFEGSARSVSYALGGIGLAVGVWQALVKFLVESSTERAYRLYQAGHTPEHAQNRLSVTPLFATAGAGASLTGNF
jgi:hypothetical protein